MIALNKKLHAIEDAGDIGVTAQHLDEMKLAKDVLLVTSILRSYHEKVHIWSPSVIEDLHDAFVSDVVRKANVYIKDIIKRSALQTFAGRTDDTKDTTKLSALKRDISLVSNLFQSLLPRPDFELDNSSRLKTRESHHFFFLNRESLDVAQNLIFSTV